VILPELQFVPYLQTSEANSISSRDLYCWIAGVY